MMHNATFPTPHSANTTATPKTGWMAITFLITLWMLMAQFAVAQPASTTANSTGTTTSQILNDDNRAIFFGVVMDRLTSTTIKGSFIELSGHVDLTTMTLDGRFQIRGLENGDYSITGSADFYSTATARISVKNPGKYGPILLRLEPLSGISGYVVDNQGIAINDVTVHINYMGGGPGGDGPRGGGPGGPGGWNFRAPRPIGPSTTTDYNGEFHATNVTPDRAFNLVFTHDKFAQTSAGPFKLTPGQLETDVKVVMEAGGGIPGIVLDEDQYPIEGADVGIIQAEGQFRGAPPIARLAAATIQGPDRMIKTEVDGRFILKNLPEGNFTIFARKDGYVYAYKDEISVPKGGEAEEITLVLRKGSILSGYVKNSNDEPVAGARIMATRFNFRDPARDQGVTDESGHFSMQSLLPGEYVVNVQAENHPELVVRQQQVPAEDVVYVLKDGGTLRGVVSSSSTDNPITKFTVEVTIQGRGGRGQGGQFGGNFPGGGGNGPNRHSFETPDGAFEIKNLAEGNYRVQVRSSGYAPASRDRVAITESQSTEIEIKMTDGLSLTGVVMRNRDHSPVSDARVELQNDGEGGGGRGGPGGGNSVANAQTDAIGGFQFTELLPGNYRLRVQADGFTEYTEQIILAPTSDDEVMVYLSSGGAVAGRVLDGATNEPMQGVQVNLTDGASGTGGRGDWRGGAGNFRDSAITANDGTFFINLVAEGKINVRITHRNYSSKDITGQTVNSDETLNLGDITLTSGGGIKGTVTRADGSAVSGAFMTANGPSGFRNTQTGADGSFEWNTLQAGEYEVSINRLPGDNDGGRGNRGGFSQQARRTVTVKDGEVVECNFQLQSGSRLTGTVTYNGEPADDWRVSYSRISGGGDDTDTRNGTMQTNNDGRFEFADLTDGKYLIAVHRRGNIGWGGGVASVVEQNITIAGADEDITLAIPESTVSGTVVDSESGAAIQGARVTIVRGDTHITADDIIGGRIQQYRNTRTNSQGQYDFDNITEGEWTVIAQHTNYSYATKNITITAGEDLDLGFSLTGGFNLTVTAVSRSTGIPVKNVYLQIYDSNGAMVREGSFLVDSLGKFTISGLKEGRQTIAGYAYFYSPVFGLSVNVYPDSNNTASLQFEDGGTLKLTVTDSTGKAVKGANVKIIYGNSGVIGYPNQFRSQASYPLSTTTDSEGKLTHEHLPSGFPTIEVSLPGGATTSDSIQIINGQASELGITLN